jgi:hypothetical protein
VIDGPTKNPWGRYRLGRAEAEGTLAYDVRLFSVVPVRGSCDCADFLRASLGLCKHLAAVLIHLARKERVFRRLVETVPQFASPFILEWDAAFAGPDGSDPVVHRGTNRRPEIREAAVGDAHW